MLKTISAALLAVSVLAVPALAAGPAKTTQAPTAKSEQAKSERVKSEQVKTKTTEQAKTGVLNANAKMGRHHHKHFSHRRSHKQMGALKTHKFSKVSKASIKHVAPSTKRS